MPQKWLNQFILVKYVAILLFMLVGTFFVQQDRAYSEDRPTLPRGGHAVVVQPYSGQDTAGPSKVKIENTQKKSSPQAAPEPSDAVQGSETQSEDTPKATAPAKSGRFRVSPEKPPVSEKKGPSEGGKN